MKVWIGVRGLISLGTPEYPTRCLSASFSTRYPLKICPKVLESLLEMELTPLNYLVA